MSSSELTVFPGLAPDGHRVKEEESAASVPGHREQLAEISCVSVHQYRHLDTKEVHWAQQGLSMLLTCPVWEV